MQITNRINQGYDSTTVLANTIEFEKVDEGESDNYTDLEFSTIDTSSVETPQQMPFIALTGHTLKVAFTKVTGNVNANVRVIGKYKDAVRDVEVAI